LLSPLQQVESLTDVANRESKRQGNKNPIFYQSSEQARR
jgi:hypothetical protein